LALPERTPRELQRAEGQEGEAAIVVGIVGVVLPVETGPLKGRWVIHENDARAVSLGSLQFQALNHAIGTTLVHPERLAGWLQREVPGDRAVARHDDANIRALSRLLGREIRDRVAQAAGERVGPQLR